MRPDPSTSGGSKLSVQCLNALSWRGSPWSRCRWWRSEYGIQHFRGTKLSVECSNTCGAMAPGAAGGGGA